MIIEKKVLSFLIEQGFKVNDISDILGCCQRTIERRMQMYGISQYIGSQASDLEFDNAVHQIAALFPRIGAKSVSGRLRSKGILIQHERVRESLRRVDPLSVRARCGRVLR